MANESPGPRPARDLARATVLAMAGAAVILVTIVLPAEYGLDPLGTGRALGLFRPAPQAAGGGDGAAVGGAAAPAGEIVAGAGGGIQLRSPRPYRTDELSVTLEPGEGAEVKAAMRQGEVIVYSWTATGDGVDVDMHGDFTDGPPGNYTGYWKDEFQKGDHGAFRAPAAGNHGWFWQNLTDVPVTVTVKTSGFYEKLFRP